MKILRKVEEIRAWEQQKITLWSGDIAHISPKNSDISNKQINNKIQQ